MGLIDWFTGKPSRDNFAQIARKALLRGGVEGPIRYDPENFQLQMGEGDDARSLFLNNAYDHYAAAPRRARRGILHEFVQGSMIPDIPETWEQIKPMLLPRVRERFYYWAMPHHMALAGHGADALPQPVTRPVSEHYEVELALDMDYAIMSLDRDKIEDLPVDEDVLFAAARDNLWARSNENFEQLVPGLYLSPWQDNWDASRLLLHDLIWQLQVKGEHVALAANRDSLMVTGSQDLDGLKRMAVLAEMAMEDPRPMSPRPVVLRGDKWEPFSLPDDDPAAKVLARLRLIADLRDYSEQKEILDREYEINAKDVYVANFSAYENTDTGDLYSLCIWSAGVLSELPVTNRVLLNPDPENKNGELIDVPWADVREITGELMQPTDQYPVRYTVSKFPDEAQVVKLRERAIKPTP